MGQNILASPILVLSLHRFYERDISIQQTQLILHGHRSIRHKQKVTEWELLFLKTSLIGLVDLNLLIILMVLTMTGKEEFHLWIDCYI